MAAFGRIPGPVGAPQDRADARDQFARLEGLGHIVVGPHFQPQYPVDGVASRRQYDDRDQGGGADGAAQAQPVLIRQVQVQHDQIDRPCVQRRLHRLAVRRLQGAETVLLQMVSQQISNVAIVVDDQQNGSGRLRHRRAR